MEKENKILFLIVLAALLGALPFFVGAVAAPIIGIGNEVLSFSMLITGGASCAAFLSLVARHYQKMFGPATAENEN